MDMKKCVRTDGDVSRRRRACGESSARRIV